MFDTFVKSNTNVTLSLNVEKVSFKDLSSGKDQLHVQDIKMETSHRNYNFSPPSGDQWTHRYYAGLNREVLVADITKQKLKLMPGFKVTWNYSNMEVEEVAKYGNDEATKAFIRNCSNIQNFLSFKAYSFYSISK